MLHDALISCAQYACRHALRLASVGIAALALTALLADDGPTITLSQGPPTYAWTSLFFYDANGNVQYQCRARSSQPTFDYLAAAQFTSVVVNSSAATVTTSANHGLQAGNGAVLAGSATGALNGSYIIGTVPSANTFTFPTSGVSNGTYTDLKTLTTTAPRSNAATWSIMRMTYNGSNQIIATQWAGGISTASQICDNRTNLTYQ